MSVTADDVFRLEYAGSRNFMTPDVIRRGTVGPFAYELSTGKGISDDKIYGVTVVRFNSTNHNRVREYDLSDCHHSLADAEAAIAALEFI